MKQVRTIAAVMVVLFLVVGIVCAAEMPGDEIAQQNKDNQRPIMRTPGQPGPMMQGQMQRGRMLFRTPQAGVSRIRGKRQGHHANFLLDARWVRLLNLNEQQVTRLKSMRNDFLKQMIDRKAAIAKANVDLKALLDNPEPDIRNVQTQMQRIADMKVQMQVASLKAAEDARNVLTPEQRTRFRELKTRQPGMRTPPGRTSETHPTGQMSQADPDNEVDYQLIFEDIKEIFSWDTVDI